MTFVNTVGDMITRIRNGQMRLLNNIKIPSSKFRTKILEVLKNVNVIMLLLNYQIHYYLI